MMELILATGNPNKVKEIQALLPEGVQAASLKLLGYNDELPEDHDTLEDNSLQKALFIYQKFGKDCLSEDTGLFVPALNGAPGVYSARYAGPQKSDADNIERLLSELGGKTDRSAYFKTVMTLIVDGVAHQFTGILEGKIATEISGAGGFGYDPIFEHVDGKTLAEISRNEKAEISHRGKALMKVLEFIKGLEKS